MSMPLRRLPEREPLVGRARGERSGPRSDLLRRATGWLRRMLLGSLVLLLLASWITVRRRSSPSPPSSPALVELPVPAHLPAAPPGAELMLIALGGGTKGVPVLRSGPWAGADSRSGRTPSNATRAVVVQHGIGRDMDHAWRDAHAALARDDAAVDTHTLLVAPNFYLSSDAGSGRWFAPETMHAWQDFDAWVGGADALDSEHGAQVSTYDLYDLLRAHFLDAERYPHLEQVVFAGHSGGGATVTRYSLFARDWPRTKPSVRYVVANAPSFLYFTPDRPRDPPCPNVGEYMYGLQRPVRYVRAALNAAALDKHSLVRRWLARPLVMLQGDQDTFARYPVGRYGCQVLAQGGKDRRERSYAYWVYKVLLAGLSPEHPKVGGKQRWSSLQFEGRDRLEASLTSWGKGKWPFLHDFCHVRNVGHVGGEMWGSACGRVALLGGEVNETVW